VQGATQSLTSVPKPLKFLSPLYDKLKDILEKASESEWKASVADLVSVVGMVAGEDDSNDALKYCIMGTRKDLVQWGHEYLRCLSGQIGAEYLKRVEKSQDFSDLITLVDQVIPEFINHNEEPEAVDLLLEVERLPQLLEFVNERNFSRVCLYLLSCSSYAADPDEMKNTFETTYRIYMKFERYPEALRVA